MFILDSNQALAQDVDRISTYNSAATESNLESIKLELERSFQSLIENYPERKFSADLKKLTSILGQASRAIQSSNSRERVVTLIDQYQELSTQIRAKYGILLDSEQMRELQDFEYRLEGSKRLSVAYQYLLQALDSSISANPIEIMHLGMVELSKTVEAYLSTFPQQTIESVKHTALAVLRLMKSKPEQLDLSQDLMDRCLSLKNAARSVLWQLDDYTKLQKPSEQQEVISVQGPQAERRSNESFIRSPDLLARLAVEAIVESRYADWDLSVSDRSGQLVLVVEVKCKTNLSPDWAVKLRRNILAHGTFPKAPYFLMVFPDKFYLWFDADTAQDQSEPTYTIDAAPILHPRFERAGVTAEQISRASLELIVLSWLAEIIHSDQLPENVDGSQRWLIESGLYAALVGGRFEHEASA